MIRGRRTRSARPRIAAVLGTLALLLMPAWAGAQIKTDGSVGPAQTLSGPNYTIPSSLGRLSGGNLFHSFKKFNIRTLGDGTIESATFTQDGPGSISNVIGRVTGGYPSSINGVLRVAIPGANLYLINPKGVVFGPNASLDVPGAVHVGTADYVKFADGTKFQADLSQESTFSVAQPAAFGFLGPAAPIVVNGSVLQVQPKQTLSLVGGDIELHGATLTAPGGRVNLVATASEGEVTLPALDVSSFAALGQVQVLEGSTVDASGDPFSGDGAGGTVAVRGVSLLVDSSTLSSNTFGDVDGTQIGIDLKLTDQLVVSGVSLIGTTSGVVFDPVEGAFVPTGGVGRGGDVSISAGTVLLNGFPLNGFYLLGTMTGSGRGGDVHITATDLTVDGAAVATTGIADGRAGDMVLDLARLTVSNSGLVASAAFGSGPTGDVLVNASESVTLTGVLSGFTIFNNDGDGGLLSIITPLLSMDGGASISSSGQSVGLGANIVITTDRLSMTNGSLITSAGVFGDAGDITVTVTGTATIAGTLEGQPGGILTSSNADAAVGDITMQVGSLSLGGGALIRSGTVSGTLGGGALSIAAQQDISITGGSGIESEAFIGDVGAVSLSARGITLDRGHISTDTLEAGRAGDILLDAQSVTLRNRSFITSTSDLLATGNAGTITIGVPATISSPARPVGRLTLENSRIATEAESAEGGDINILASQIVYLLDSSIKTSVHGGSGSGGNIFIDPQFVVLNSSEIRADAIAGNGGNLDIITDVFLTSDSILSATSRFGVPGTIDVRANITDVSGALVQLPADVLEATTLLRASCATRLADSKTSSLVVATRDGVPREPGGLLPSPVRARPPEEPGFGSADAPAPALRLAGLFLESPCAR